MLEQVADLHLEQLAQLLDCLEVDPYRRFLVEQCDRVAMKPRHAGYVDHLQLALAHQPGQVAPYHCRHSERIKVIMDEQKTFWASFLRLECHLG